MKVIFIGLPTNSVDASNGAEVADWVTFELDAAVKPTGVLVGWKILSWTLFYEDKLRNQTFDPAAHYTDLQIKGILVTAEFAGLKPL